MSMIPSDATLQQQQADDSEEADGNEDADGREEADDSKEADGREDAAGLAGDAEGRAAYMCPVKGHMDVELAHLSPHQPNSTRPIFLPHRSTA